MPFLCITMPDGSRPEGYCRLIWDEDRGYWAYAFNGKRRRATDLGWPNNARIHKDPPRRNANGDEFEPYPLEHLAKILRMSHSDTLSVIDRFGEFYRKRT